MIIGNIMLETYSSVVNNYNMRILLMVLDVFWYTSFVPYCRLNCLYVSYGTGTCCLLATYCI